MLKRIKSILLGNGLAMGESTKSLIVLVSIVVLLVIAVTSIPFEFMVAALIGALVSWIIVPFLILFILARGLDTNDYDPDN